MNARWRDVRGDRDVWLITGSTAADWPVTRPWDSERFALLIATDQPFDASDLAPGMLAQGLASVATWGPNCSEVEVQFDSAIVTGGDLEDDNNCILTSSFAEPLDEALVSFPAIERAELCKAWVIFAVGDVASTIARLLDGRGSLLER